MKPDHGAAGEKEGESAGGGAGPLTENGIAST